MPWVPEDEPGWQIEMLRRMPPSVDETLLAEMKRLTPIERFRRWQKLMERARQMRRAGEEVPPAFGALRDNTK